MSFNLSISQNNNEISFKSLGGNNDFEMTLRFNKNKYSFETNINECELIKNDNNNDSVKSNEHNIFSKCFNETNKQDIDLSWKLNLKSQETEEEEITDNNDTDYIYESEDSSDSEEEINDNINDPDYIYESEDSSDEDDCKEEEENSDDESCDDTHGEYQEEIKETNLKRCMSKTLSGKLCKKYATNTALYCYQHSQIIKNDDSLYKLKFTRPIKYTIPPLYTTKDYLKKEEEMSKFLCDTLFYRYIEFTGDTNSDVKNIIEKLMILMLTYNVHDDYFTFNDIEYVLDKGIKNYCLLSSQKRKNIKLIELFEMCHK